jgi:flagellar basal-body rod modification protein FlgD
MDIARVNQGLGIQAQQAPSDREQLSENSIAQFQARYGEKPKEARPIKKTLDKDDFMRIMITEMRHQDPSKPMDADRMATQLAQITSVEQMKNIGGAIEKLSDKNSASDRLAMSGLIGKTVTVDKGRFSHQKGTVSPVSFDLPEDASKVKLVIMNERGEDIAERELEPKNAGANVYDWDGINSSNTSVPTGTYMVRVEAENANGNKINVNSVSIDKVVGVSFEGGEPNLLVGDSKTPQRVPFRSVTRIESDGKVQPQAKKSTGPDALPSGLQDKLKLEMAKNTAAADSGPKPAESVAAEAPAVAEGFPNGLQD